MNIKIAQRKSGFVALIVLILLLIMVVFAATTTATVIRLRREVKLVERQQIHRLSKPASVSK